MTEFRSAEDQRKEFDLQAVQTERINYRLQDALGCGDTLYQGRLEELAVFANVLRPYAPAESYVVLCPRPEIQFHAEGDGYSSTIYITGNTWRYKVNGTEEAASVDAAKAYKPGRQLLRMWEVVIPLLPENFIIRSVRGSGAVEEVQAARDHICDYLGLSVDPGSREVLGIVKNGVVNPITYEEVRTLTGNTPMYLDQKFNVRTIEWAGA